mmetsp:Transcript_1955/g.3404  ORF Transcript_1955/g.3404 Transcript_1955/m.3404 type:complete len:93 (+) Transcript_1955:864-1142(+)
MTSNLSKLNQDSLESQVEYLETSVKDQQRKIVVIAQLCDLIQEKATPLQATQMSCGADHQQVKSIPPFHGMDSTQLTLQYDKMSQDIIYNDK